MNTSNNNLAEFILEKLDIVRNFILEHIKIVLPVFVGIIALIVCIIALSVHAKNEQKAIIEEQAAAAEAETESQTNIAENIISIPDIPLEENAIPEVNEFIDKYYQAMGDGDVDTMRTMDNYIDDTEIIRIEETAKYIDAYIANAVYTKTGPVDGSYITYVFTQIKFNDYDTKVPGLDAYYICTDENGNLYINDTEDTESVINYIREASLQDDVIDLNNRVAVEYNNMIAEDENLPTFLVDLTEAIDTSVGEILARAESSQEAEAEEAEEAEEEAGTGISATTVTKVKTTTTVNVRSSDSETADKVGKANAGQEFKLIEKRGNGWSQIEYEGKNAFIKTEFLEDVGTETMVTVDNGDDNTVSETEQTQSTTNSSSNKVSGTVTVKDNVRIRSGASENADKIATAYVGQKLDLIMKQADGWTKVMYNGQVAYVKSDYVE